jgi:hypothetical protein
MKVTPFLFMILLLLSISSFAQTQHGGGGPDGDEIPEEFSKMIPAYKRTLQKLNERWKKCINKAEPDFENLDQVYIQLFWRDSVSYTHKQECEMLPVRVAESKGDCVFDRKTRNDIRQFFDHPDIIPFLKFVEGNDHVEAKILLFRKYIHAKRK